MEHGKDLFLVQTYKPSAVFHARKLQASTPSAPMQTFKIPELKRRKRNSLPTIFLKVACCQISHHQPLHHSGFIFKYLTPESETLWSFSSTKFFPSGFFTTWIQPSFSMLEVF